MASTGNVRYLPAHYRYQVSSKYSSQKYLFYFNYIESSWKLLHHFEVLDVWSYVFDETGEP